MNRPFLLLDPGGETLARLFGASHTSEMTLQERWCRDIERIHGGTPKTGYTARVRAAQRAAAERRAA